ncbi:sensor histidine kinase [Streptomyces sp. NBC_00989]|uniref:sensor histidine kinase n=1 Tax=Streptomyces sp. NBC_00989 TaxID=2903705 RepID=UPI00386543BF|nr:sensor histidine kinase [Streptomyces sp. NBC_00989]
MSLSQQEDRLSLVDFLPAPSRPTNPWAQILRDLHAPAPMSHWSTRVTAARIHRHDRLRPFATRGFLLVVLAVLFVLADGVRPAAWALLSVGVTQTLLEIHLDGQAHGGKRARFALTRLLLAWQDNWQWERTLLNATGLLGGIAVPANVVAVLFFTGPGHPGWVKVAALGVALAYANSGIYQVLTDGTYYSANQSLPRILVTLRAYGWLLVTGVLALVVGLSVHLGRWHPEMVPLAWAVCALPYAVGLKMRDYDRCLRASGEEAAVAMTEARSRLAQDFHDTLNAVRSLSRALARDDSVSPEYKIDAADLAPKLTLVKEMVDEYAWEAQGREITLEGVVEQLGRDHSLRVTAEFGLGELRPENRELVRQLITTVVANAAQAMARLEIHDRPVSVSGQVSDGMIHLSIRDPLPLIPAAAWCPDGSTLAVMRGRLRRLGGDMTQTAVAGGKEIRGVWSVRPPRLKRGSTR